MNTGSENDMTELQRCINELCLLCGKYELEHEGACEGCEWLKKKYAPIKSADEFAQDMADDLQNYCETRQCYSEIELEDGRIIAAYKCPFLEDDCEVWEAPCVLGDPTSWRI